jgi:hypothetical protein
MQCLLRHIAEQYNLEALEFETNIGVADARKGFCVTSNIYRKKTAP